MTAYQNSYNNNCMFPIGEKLQRLRKKARISGRTLAEEAGVTWARYSTWEYQYKKPFLPVDAIKQLLPPLERHGIDPYIIWEELGGITRADLLGQAGQDTITVKLDSGSLATGIPAEIYTSPSDFALARYVGPGLVVVAELKKRGKTTVAPYKIGKEGANFTLEPYQGEEGDPLEYLAGSDNWYTGIARKMGDEYNCRITLVVREFSMLANKEFF